MSTDHAETDALELKLEQAWPLRKWENVSTLVAVSGGADSVALLRALHALKYQVSSPQDTHACETDVTSQSTGLARLAVAHFNHRWRPEASDRDEAFVEELCDQLQVPCYIGRSAGHDQTEETARNERYEFLRSSAEMLGMRYLVTAHTANDQAETILHRILRGTSLRGLRGIQPARRMSEAVTIVRPMLSVTRDEVLNYLNRLNQPFRIDETNADTRFTRNRIRHELLPHLAHDYNTSIVESLLRLGSIAQDAVEVVESAIHPEVENCVLLRNDKTVELDRLKLCALSDYLQREIVVHLWRAQGWPEQSMGFEQWKRLVRSIQEASTINLPGNILVRSDSTITRFHQLPNDPTSSA